jgi:hypothetical protein
VIDIGKIYSCRISVKGSAYVFSVEGLNPVTLPRAATTATGNGYRLFPYFGGNNAAPHEMHIWLKYMP